jgi:aryl-alcohol dehydrogenase-like predicted oxidoreductase
MYAWQFAKALHVSDTHGWARFATMQNYVNLLYREEEREMLPLCKAEGVGVIPWSPLARGRLTRDWDASTARQESDEFGRSLYAKTQDADRKVVEALTAVAARLGRPRAQVALAWVLGKSEIAAPIVGATRLEQLDDAVAALTLALSPADVAELEAPYLPHPIIGHA